MSAANEPHAAPFFPAETHDRRPRMYRGPRPGRVHWSALAVGSVTGLSSWALLYTLGAAVAWREAAVMPSGGLGLYGAVAAAIALAAGSYVASRAGGAKDTGCGVLYGITMAGMANLTLTATAVALSGGWGRDLPPVMQSLVAVGASALAMTGAPGDVPLSLNLYAMATIMVLSFALGALGGRLGAARGRSIGDDAA